MTSSALEGTQSVGERAPGGRIRIGSEAHKQLFCRMLLDTFDPYKPAVIDWPKLSGDALRRLTSLPFWRVAVETEGHASITMQSAADAIADPLIREAVALNAFEERRHKEVLHNMLNFYGIDIGEEPPYPMPPNPLWSYIRTGYGECFDSFFAFGLFALAKESGYFPIELVEVFEPVIQEEARHILFFVNWIAYASVNRPVWRRPGFMALRGYALASKALNRLALAKGRTDANTELTDSKSIGIDLSPRKFLDLCLSENYRRMARYDPRLLRPEAMPRIVRLSRPLLGRGDA
ncbi:MAG: ferritin-like domain-containing protein [Candidatus Eiseniibacteriota bacterium]